MVYTKKIKKSKKRGGHVFYYEDRMIQKCRQGFLGVHDSDCWPNTLYLLGILTRRMAERFAMDTNHVTQDGGISGQAIINWFNEALGVDHTIDHIFDSNEGPYNEWFMAYLNFLMPYNQMGMPITYEMYDENDIFIGGHALCLIRSRFGQFIILDAQVGTIRYLYSIYDMLEILPAECHRIVVSAYMQTTLYDEWHRRTDNGNNYNISPYVENFYNTANNTVRQRMMYPGINYEENNYNMNENQNRWWNQSPNEPNQEEPNGGWNQGYHSGLPPNVGGGGWHRGGNIKSVKKYKKNKTKSKK